MERGPEGFVEGIDALRSLSYGLHYDFIDPETDLSSAAFAPPEVVYRIVGQGDSNVHALLFSKMVLRRGEAERLIAVQVAGRLCLNFARTVSISILVISVADACVSISSQVDPDDRFFRCGVDSH